MQTPIYWLPAVDPRVAGPGDGQPRIVDVAVEGVSMMLTFRSEFDAIVARSGIDGLLQELAGRSRAAAAKAG